MAAVTSFLGAATTSTACFLSKRLPLQRSNNGPRDSSLRLLPSFRSPLFWVQKSDYVHALRSPRFSSWPTVAEGEPAVIGEQRSDEEEEEGRGDELEEAAHTTKLYFGNLPYSCDSAQLAAIVQDYGSPELVEVLYDRSTGKSRGFAFVTMSSVQDANAVIQNLDGSEYGGRTLRVNFSDKPKPREPLYPETEFKLFVGNLSWRVTSESLTEIFSECGNVVGARVLYDGETGRSRGYGFVCYSSKTEMDAALDSLNGVELDGRQLRISLALGKKS